MTTLVFDNTALNHFAKAGRLTELRTIVEGYQCVAPAEVFSELARAVAEYPALGTISAQDWLKPNGLALRLCLVSLPFRGT